MIADRIRPVRAKSTELHIEWHEAEHLLIRTMDKLLRRDERPLKVQRGEFLAMITAELEQIKEHAREFRNFDQLVQKFSRFAVVHLLQGPSFIDDDRAYLATPNSWLTRPGSYARAILNKHWGDKSNETYKSYRHALVTRKQDRDGSLLIGTGMRPCT
jgi:urease gamma subunit